MNILASVALSFVAVVGCGGPTTDDAIGSAESDLLRGYERIVRCDGNAIEVAVKKSERRELMVHINDKNIVKYLASADVDLAAKVGSDGRLAIPDFVWDGIFEPTQWNFFEVNLVEPTGESPVRNKFRVFRDGANLKAQVIRPAAYVCSYPNAGASGRQEIEWPIDSTFCRQMGGFIPGDFLERRPERERANWYFQSCD